MKAALHRLPDKKGCTKSRRPASTEHQKNDGRRYPSRCARSIPAVRGWGPPAPFGADPYSNSLLTDSLRWMRLMASASSGGHAQHLDVGQLLLRRQRDAVGDDDLLDRRVAQPLDGVAAQDGVGGAGVDLAGAVRAWPRWRPRPRCRPSKSCRRRSPRPCLPARRRSGWPACVSVALERRLSTMAMAPPSFFWYSERLLDAALVGAEHDEIARRDVQAADVFVDDRAGVQVIDGDVEEALDLGGVQVEGQDAVGAGRRSAGRPPAWP